MASSKIKGITIEIGGDTTKLGKAIADSEKQSKSLQGELKQVEKLLKFDPGNTELLAQKQKILTEAVKETTDKLEILRKAEEQVIEQFNRGDIGEDQLRAFQREIIKTQSELDDFDAKLNGTEDNVKDVGEAAEESSGGFTVMKGALADLTANAISGAISKIGDFIGSLMELSEATEEYRTMQAKLEGSSETFGYTTDFAKSKYEEFYKYLGDDQAATNAVTNLMGIGTSTESLSKLVEGATGAWSAYGDSINVESLTEAISETIVCGKVTGSFADTINWTKDSSENLKSALSGNKDAQKAYNEAIKEGLPVEDAFNEALAKITDEQERADVVAKFLNNTYGESKTKYDELNGSVMEANEAELKLKDTQAQLGETMAPVNNAITDLKAQALDAIAPVVEKCANGFLNMLNWLKEHPAAMTAITTVAIALAAAFTVLATALAIQGIITGVTKAIAFLNTTLLANPIVLIIAAIAALVAAFIYLWNNCDAFREFWLDLWTKVKTFFINAWNSVKSFCTNTIPKIIDNVVNWFKQLPGKIWTWLQNTISKVTTWASNLKQKATSAASNFINSVVNFFKQLPGKIWTWLSNAVTRVVTWGSNLASKGKEAARKLLDSIVNKVKEIPGKLKSIGTDIVKGLWNGINGSVSWLTSKIKGFCSSALGAIKKFFGIKSPSTLMRDEVGRYISEGIGVGISDNADKPIGALETLGDDIVDGAGNLNLGTINRKLTTTFSVGAAGNAMGNDTLLGKLDNIYDRLNRLQIVLDTGTLVGETIDKIDAGLATRQLLSARGV